MILCGKELTGFEKNKVITPGNSNEFIFPICNGIALKFATLVMKQ